MAAHPIVDSFRYRGDFVEVDCVGCAHVFLFPVGSHDCAVEFCCVRCREDRPGVAARLDDGRPAFIKAPAPSVPRLPAKMRFVRRAA